MCIRDSVTAADIQADQDIEIMNPEQVIATLNGGKDCRLAMELTITKGRGYVSADKGKSDDMPIGVIAVDAIYTPVDLSLIHICVCMPAKMSCQEYWAVLELRFCPQTRE